MELVLATRNRHKVEEIVAALALPGVTVRTLDDFPDAPEVVEDGDTFEANARKKAREVAEATGLPALADDSGLVVDALGGEPGVRSARFAGEDSDDAANRALLRERMSGVPDGKRTARFVCALALVMPRGETLVVEQVCEGTLLFEDRGSGGFGYDALFVPKGHDRTFAQISRDEKAGFSHRGRALRVAAGPIGRVLRAFADG